jgi:hypothetical protein
MRAVFAKAGGVSAWEEPGVIRVETSADAAAKLIDPSVRAQLRSTTHDIVTAATLALMTTG